MVKKNAKPKTCEKKLCYGLESVAAVIEIRGSSLVSYKGKFEEDIKTKQILNKKVAGRHRSIKWLYLTFREREKTRSTFASNYVQLCRKYLGQDFFYLRESTTKKIIPGEWERFVKALLDP